ncbi:hypothetical protein EV177_004703 [Coemansia sp. RSA 1804]|nr:hypothetical protein EV177_004703 [Coemansia sp. RSA 1804]
MKTARSIELESNRGYETGMGCVMSTVRAARSHHDLHSTTTNNPSFSQSMFSLESKDKTAPETSAFLSSPEISQNCEYGTEKSSGTITLVSYVHGQHPASPEQDASTRAPTLQDYCFERQTNSQLPPLSIPVPRRQYSMAQIEARLSNRNSMMISDALFSGVSSSSSSDLDQSLDVTGYLTKNRARQDSATEDIPIEVDPRRTSRYLYNVPSGPFRSSMHGPLAKMLQWPQRINHNAPRRIRRTRSSVIDQHKIYDIYEEAIWHSSHIPKRNIPGSRHAKNEPFSDKHAEPNSESENLFRSRIIYRKASTIGNIAATRFKSLGSARASGISWNFIRSWKPRRDQQEEEEHQDWYDPSSMGQSHTDNIDEIEDSENDGESFDLNGSLFPVIADTSTNTDINTSTSASETVDGNDTHDKKPARKQSALETLVKRAGIGLLRRSTSFYKTASDMVAEGGKSSKPALNTRCQYDFGISSADVGISDPKKHTMRKRLTSAVRQATERIRNPLKYLDSADKLRSDEDEDIVSAYPLDSMKEKELDSYLSLSVLHSPVISSSEESCGSAPQRMPTSDETVCHDQYSTAIPSMRYVPPKRPPFLGLNRKIARTPAVDCSGRPLSTISMEGMQPAPQDTNVVAPSRLRPTQFNSPFMTLPYATYAQLSQTGGHHQ